MANLYEGEPDARQEPAMIAREKRIRERAYQLWEQAGKPGDEHHRFWHEAEAEIDAEDNQSPTPLIVPRRR
jgi:hypothetical protein